MASSMPPPPTPPEIKFGTRIHVGANVATIRWGPGTLAGQGETIWYGIEYDGPHGKHDGNHKGDRKFQCPNGHGSFCKIPKIDRGLDLKSAIEYKNTDEDVPLSLHDYENNRTRNLEFVGREKVLERMEQWSSHGEMMLSTCKINDCINAELMDKSMHFTNLYRLALDWNLITSWELIDKILSAAPKIEFLGLTGNKMEIYDESNSSSKYGVYPNVKNLVLNETDLDFDQVPLSMFPALKAIHLGRNKLGDIKKLDEKIAAKLPDLEILGLEENFYTDMNAVLEQVKLFPNLKDINFNDCQIKDPLITDEKEESETEYEKNKVKKESDESELDEFVKKESVKSGHPAKAIPAAARESEKAGDKKSDKTLAENLKDKDFSPSSRSQKSDTGASKDGEGTNSKKSPDKIENAKEPEFDVEKLRNAKLLPESITALSLTGNKVKSWTTAGWIGLQPQLKELRLHNNPIGEDGQSQGLRQVLISVLPNLKLLNGSEITSRERANCERLFLSLFLTETSVSKIIRSQIDPDEVHRKRLIEIHGDGIVHGDINSAQGAAFASSLIKIKIQPVAMSICNMEVFNKRVPHTMTIGDLKKLCSTIYKGIVPAREIKLAFIEPGAIFGSTFDINDEYRELSFFGIGDGCEIRVDQYDEDELKAKK